jgi:isopropylmalate/homocitrate/citramalate synthase
MTDPKIVTRPAADLLVPPTAYTSELGFPAPDTIRIYDTTLRDGEQTPGVAFTPAQKYRIAEIASRLGCHILDVGFPATDEADRETLRMLLLGRQAGKLRPDIELVVLCRADKHDIDCTVDAIEQCGADPSAVCLCIFTSGSDLHIRYKLGDMLLRRGQIAGTRESAPIELLRDENARMVRQAFAYARSRGATNLEFGAEDSSRAPIEQVIELARTAIEAGAKRYVFADTNGSLSPESTAFYVGRLRTQFPETPIVCHFHNDHDLATINTITACRAGATALTVTINGIGERAGNAAMHSVLIALRQIYNIELPGVRYDLLREASAILERLTGIAVSPNEPVLGACVFLHESGIHTHGMMSNPLTYEPIPAELIGAERGFVYGKHSGRAVVRQALERARDRLAAQGVIIDDKIVDAVLGEVKAIRMRRAEANMAEHGVWLAHESHRRLALHEEDVVGIAEAMARVRLPEPDNAAVSRRVEAKRKAGDRR